MGNDAIEAVSNKFKDIMTGFGSRVTPQSLKNTVKKPLFEMTGVPNISGVSIFPQASVSNPTAGTGI